MRLVVDEVAVTLDSTPVLRGVSVEVAQGTIVGLVGPNGSGKSTLLRTVYRSLRPHRGAVRLGEADVWAMSARESALRTAAVLQDNTIPAGMTVAEVVELGRTPHKGDGRAPVQEAMRRTGTLALAGRPFGALSGGERQRVLLAKALAQHPVLLVLDEPTNHLDIRARFELLALVRELGVTTLAVLHDLDLAVRSCDALVVLCDGRVAAAGSPLDALTPGVLSEVFGVVGEVAAHPDGVARITYAASPLAVDLARAELPERMRS
ncbi:ABC transporter ATP-binding protein [Nonomuraea sp. NPDC003804]|uniref:ABC transporter ATP-binding protein n=1 Tax=Nonomuraea sp. NPDC003804 TaxID=3154547 RepID=UPI0033ABB54B